MEGEVEMQMQTVVAARICALFISVGRRALGFIRG